MADYLENENDVRKRVEQRLNARKELVIHSTVFGAVITGLWALWFMTGANPFGGFPWPIIVTLGWLSGLAGHAVDAWFKVGWPSHHVDEKVWTEMNALYGRDWRETVSRDEYNDVRRRVAEPTNKIKELSIHVAVYAAINIMLWVMWLFTGSNGGFPWAALVSGAWGIGLVAHASEVLSNRSRHRALEREMEREQERMDRILEQTGKRKREQIHQERREERREARLEVSDDGELVEIFDNYDSYEDAPKHKRG